MLDTHYLDRLAKEGLRPEDIDYVLCTHLHVDHVGWNTRLVDGRWVPTFTNARYVVSRKEFEAAQQELSNPKIMPVAKATFEDSVLPIVEPARSCWSMTFMSCWTDTLSGPLAKPRQHRASLQRQAGRLCRRPRSLTHSGSHVEVEHSHRLEPAHGRREPAQAL